LPFGTRARVTSLTNARTVHVRINDRGPFVGGRIIDLSRAAAKELDMLGPGIMRVRVEVPEAAAPRVFAAARMAPAPAPPEPAIVPAVEVAAAAEPAAAEPVTPAYVIRLGTFTRRDDADRFRREVARRFPDAWVSPLDTGLGEYYRVQLGPYGARRSAEARAELAGRLGYSAVVSAE
jgi:rare lipoprotein A